MKCRRNRSAHRLACGALTALLAFTVPTVAADAPTPGVLELALSGYHQAVADGEIADGALLTIIDYALPSTEPRLFVYDPTNGEVLVTSLVAHGKNSGADMATEFSNEPGSLMSDLGFHVTGDTYEGKHGYTLKLRGLEPGINDNAMARSIVIHGADYVSEEFAATHGRLGRSWGCPALPLDVAAEVIDLIKGGTLVFVHGNDSTYRQQSRYSP